MLAPSVLIEKAKSITTTGSKVADLIRENKLTPFDAVSIKSTPSYVMSLSNISYSDMLDINLIVLDDEPQESKNLYRKFERKALWRTI